MVHETREGVGRRDCGGGVVVLLFAKDSGIIDGENRDCCGGGGRCASGPTPTGYNFALPFFILALV